jgi:hypothetical protein
VWPCISQRCVSLVNRNECTVLEFLVYLPFSQLLSHIHSPCFFWPTKNACRAGWEEDGRHNLTEATAMSKIRKEEGDGHDKHAVRCVVKISGPKPRKIMKNLQMYSSVIISFLLIHQFHFYRLAAATVASQNSSNTENQILS